jgi:hypothetical protein
MRAWMATQVAHYEGMEDQFGALGLVLNAIVLFNTRYLDAAITELRAGGHEVPDEGTARLSPFGRLPTSTSWAATAAARPARLARACGPRRDPSAAGLDEDDSASE